MLRVGGWGTSYLFQRLDPELGIQRGFITVAVGLVLNVPSTTLGQAAGPPIELRIGGAVRNAGLFNVDSTVTVAGALAMAGGPTAESHREKVWVFRDGEIITTIEGGDDFNC